MRQTYLQPWSFWKPKSVGVLSKVIRGIFNGTVVIVSGEGILQQWAFIHVQVQLVCPVDGKNIAFRAFLRWWVKSFIHLEFYTNKWKFTVMCTGSCNSSSATADYKKYIRIHLVPCKAFTEYGYFCVCQGCCSSFVNVPPISIHAWSRATVLWVYY